MQSPSPKRRVIHPWPLRLMHWLNAFAIIMMIGSGWQIYDASPLFGFTFPPLITIGGWLGAAIAWHLAFMWLLAINGLIYVIWTPGQRALPQVLSPQPCKRAARPARGPAVRSAARYGRL